MSMELAFALFIALLYGPTALWLAYRTIRGHRTRLPTLTDLASQSTPGSQPVPNVLEALVGPDGFWACAACHSLNRREARRCYSCRTAKDSGVDAAPATTPVGGWVPVMADGIARTPGEVAGSAAVLVTPRIAPPAPDVPVLAAVTVPVAAATAPAAAPQAAGAAASSPADAARPAPSAPLLPLPSPGPADAAAAAADVPLACPFLGLAADPLTRYDFPDPANHCHATGSRRSSAIDAEHQRSRCLTVSHAQCARYRTVEVTAPTRR